MSISIIVPHQNKRQEMFIEMMDSIKQQTLQPLEIIEMVGEDYPMKRINAGIKKAKGNYILVLSDDDKLHPRFLEITNSYMENNDIVGTFIQQFGDLDGYHGPEKHPFFSSLFRKSMWEQVGGFDENMKQLSDIDFWIKCLKSGARWQTVPGTFYYYRVHEVQDSKNIANKTIIKEFINRHNFNPYDFSFNTND